MSDIKIKRCPFCGGLPVKSSNDNGEGFMDAWIECVNLKCEINPHVSDPNMHSALEFWNQRHDDNLTNQVAELRRGLAKCLNLDEDGRFEVITKLLEQTH